MSAKRYGNGENSGSLTGRLVHGVPRFLLTVVVLVAAALLLDPAAAHAQGAYVDTPQVCTTSDAGTGVIPQAHITQSCVGTTADGSEIVFSLTLKRGTDPTTWTGATGDSFDVSLDGVTDSYVVAWTAAAGASVVAVADPTTSLCTPDTVYNAPSTYLIEVDPSCLGTPPAISWSASFTYDDGLGETFTDSSPGTGRAGPVIFDGPATATFTNSTPPAVTATDTSTFTETAPWQIAYSYDCTALGAPGDFDVTVVGAPGATDPGISEVGTEGSGTSGPNTNAGSFYLSVLGSGCDWTITVSPVPTPPPTTTTTPPTTTPPTTTPPTTTPPTSPPPTTPPTSPPPTLAPTAPTIPLTPAQTATVDRASEHTHATLNDAVVQAPKTSTTTTSSPTTTTSDPAASAATTTSSTPVAIAATGSVGVIGGTEAARLGVLPSAHHSGASIPPWLLVIPGLLVVGVPGVGVVRRRRKMNPGAMAWTPDDALIAQAGILVPGASAAMTATVVPSATPGLHRRPHVVMWLAVRRWIDLLDQRRILIACTVLVVIAVTAGAVVKWGFSSSAPPSAGASGSLTQLTVPSINKFTVPAGSIPTAGQAGAPTPAEDAAVQNWWALNGKWPTIFLNDQIAVRSDQYAPIATTTGASNLLENNLTFALKLPPVPDATLQSDWKHMLDANQSAGSSVVEWIYTAGKGGSGSWNEILTEFQRADAWATELVQEASAFGVK